MYTSNTILSQFLDFNNLHLQILLQITLLKHSQPCHTGAAASPVRLVCCSPKRFEDSIHRVFSPSKWQIILKMALWLMADDAKGAGEKNKNPPRPKSSQDFESLVRSEMARWASATTSLQNPTYMFEEKIGRLTPSLLGHWWVSLPGQVVCCNRQPCEGPRFNRIWS